jgi:YVTN family beta-propeller protein
MSISSGFSLMLTITVASSMVIPWHMVDASGTQHFSARNCSKALNAGTAQQVNRPSIPAAGLGVLNGPLSVAVDNKTNVVYVANSASNTVSVIAPTGRILANISVAHFPISLAFDPATNLVYVASLRSTTVSVIDTITNRVVSQFFMDAPISLVVDHPDVSTSLLYVIHGRGVLNVGNIGNPSPYHMERDIIKDYPLRRYVAVNPHTHMLYAAGLTDIAVINSSGVSPDTNTTGKVGDIHVSGDIIQSLAVDPKTNMIYVAALHYITAALRYGVVIVVNGSTNQPICTISIPGTPDSVAINSKSNKVYVSTIDGTVLVIDGRSNTLLKDGVRVYPRQTDFPREIAFNPNTNILFVPNDASDTVSFINGSKYTGLVGVSFQIEPQKSGSLSCDGREVNNSTTLLYDSNRILTCEAKANSVFPPPFSSWSIFPPIAFSSWSGDLAPGPDSNKDIITFKPTHFGTLVANFNVLSEGYITTLLAIAIPAVGGLFLYYLRGWFYKIRGEKNLNKYKILVDETLKIVNRDKNDLIQLFEEIRKRLVDLYLDGKINDIQYVRLIDYISDHIERIQGQLFAPQGSKGESSKEE